VFSVVSAALVTKQRCGEHTSAAVNQHTTIEEAVFSVVADPRLYNEDYRPARIRTELSSGVGSWQNNGKKGISQCEEDFICDLK
jgi:hypothetical protein